MSKSNIKKSPIKDKNKNKEKEKENDNTVIHSNPSAIKISKYDSALEYAKEGRVTALKELIDENQEDETFIDYYHNKSQNTWLSIACTEGQLDIVSLLVEYECKVDIRNGKLNTPLIEACIGGYIEIVEILINASADINIQGNQENTALCYAAKYGHDAVVELLINNNCNLETINNEGETALFLALKYEKLSTAKILIKNNCNINILDTSNMSVLMRLVFAGRLLTLEFIFKNSNPNINIKNNNNETLLIVAVKNRLIDICNLLIIQGISINDQDDSGKTALIWACMSNSNDIVTKLLQLHKSKTLESIGNKLIEFDFDIQDIWGCTALIYITKELSLYNILEWLIELGANSNIQDRQFNTALFHACMAQNIKAVVYLLQNGGADPSLTNENEKYAIDYLEQEDYKLMYMEAIKCTIKPIKIPKNGYKKKPYWIKDTYKII